MDDFGGYTREEITELFAWDWGYTSSRGGVRLHHVAKVLGPDHGYVGAVGRTSCGMTLSLRIPGLMSRMGMPRCKHCCRKLGWPEGVGSPKNDDALRPLVEEIIG